MNIRASVLSNQTVRKLFNHGAHIGAPLQMAMGGMKGRTHRCAPTTLPLHLVCTYKDDELYKP